MLSTVPGWVVRRWCTPHPVTVLSMPAPLPTRKNGPLGSMASRGARRVREYTEYTEYTGIPGTPVYTGIHGNTREYGSNPGIPGIHGNTGYTG